MEGLDAPTRSTVYVPSSRKQAPHWYGWAVAGTVALAATAAHGFYKPVSSAILAILLGALLRNLSLVPDAILDGCKGLVKRVIPLTIVLTGATLNLTDVAKSLPYLAVVLLTIFAGTAAAIVAGRLFGATRKASQLVGAGTSICGNSAVISVAPVIRASDEDLLLSLGTINILGLAIMLVLPFAGRLLGMSPEAFGVWAGATVHAVPQAVTTGFAFGPEAGAVATLVKLMRVALLAPFVLVIALLARRENGTTNEKIGFGGLLPPFVWGFAVFAALNTLGLLPELTFRPLGMAAPWATATTKLLAEAGAILLTLSMAAMGLEVNVKQLARTGGPALAAGLVASILQCVLTLIAIRWIL